MSDYDRGLSRGLRDAVAMCRMLLYGDGDGAWPRGSRERRGAHDLTDALLMRVAVELAAIESGGRAVFTHG